MIDAKPIGREWRALAFRMDAGGAWRPVVAYRAAGQGSQLLVRVAFWNGSSWVKHDLPSTSDRGDVSLAFDDLGRTAVAYHDDINHDGHPDTPRVAVLDQGVWQIETVDSPPDPRTLSVYRLSLAWNPAAGEFWLSQVELNPSHTARVCHPSPGGDPWSCEPLPEETAFDTALAFSEDGTAWVAVPVEDATHASVCLLRIWKRDTTDPQAPWTVETFVVVGEQDGIAPPSSMERRIAALRKAGIEVEYHKYKNLGHGFGLGTGTSAEGWIPEAVRFWEKFITQRN